MGEKGPGGTTIALQSLSANIDLSRCECKSRASDDFMPIVYSSERMSVLQRECGILREARSSFVIAGKLSSSYRQQHSSSGDGGEENPNSRRKHFAEDKSITPCVPCEMWEIQ